MAPRLGFEPRLPGPEPGVLPLDDLGMLLVRKLESYKVHKVIYSPACIAVAVLSGGGPLDDPRIKLVRKLESYKVIYFLAISYFKSKS